jgi:hypothetical protein
MSWGADIIIKHEDGYSTNVEVVDGHTYNLTPMWRKAGIFDYSHDLQGRNAGELAPILAAGLIDALSHSDDYRELNPSNGWGDYDGFVEILTRFTRLAYEHPTGTIEWSG